MTSVCCLSIQSGGLYMTTYWRLAWIPTSSDIPTCTMGYVDMTMYLPNSRMLLLTPLFGTPFTLGNNKQDVTKQPHAILRPIGYYTVTVYVRHHKTLRPSGFILVYWAFRIPWLQCLTFLVENRILIHLESLYLEPFYLNPYTLNHFTLGQQQTRCL